MAESQIHQQRSFSLSSNTVPLQHVLQMLTDLKRDQMVKTYIYIAIYYGYCMAKLSIKHLFTRCGWISAFYHS